MLFDLERIAKFGDRKMLVSDDGRSLSYAEVADRAAVLAGALQFPSGLVAVEMAPTPDFVVAYIAVHAAGHAVMPLPAGELATITSCEARFRPSLSIRNERGRPRVVRHGHAPASVHPDLALLLLTSGSTGQGKGVRLSRNAVDSNALAIANYLELTTDDRAALVLPLHYSYGLSVLHSHLACGASLWLHDGSVLDSGFAERLASSGATNFAGVPHHFEMLEANGIDGTLPPALTLATVAGGAMPPAAVRRWAERMAERQGRFVVMYGQTEAAPRIAWLPPHLAAGNPDAMGQAIPGGRLSLRAPDGSEIEEPGIEGELHYRGPNVMMGYAADHRNLASPGEIDELATGDLAVRDAAGLFRITGRLSRISKIAGLRIGHDALERALSTDGRTVAVWGDDRHISVATDGPTRGLAGEAARLAGIGARHVRVIECDALPRRANGKLDYQALKDAGVSLEAGATVFEAFREAFALQRVNGRDSFASLGGDSLRHVELSLALEERLGGLPNGWERMSVTELQGAEPEPRHALPTDLVARALAILAVVVAHQTFWSVYGGAAAMVILMGMSVAGFRWQHLISGDIRGFLLPVVGVLVAYYAVLAGYALAWEAIPWHSVFLVGNLGMTVPETHLMLPYLYWFIEAYVQMSLIVAALFLIVPVRTRLVSLGLFRTGLTLLALAVLLRVTLAEIWPMDGRAQFTVSWVFYLFAFGWCIAAAGKGREKALVLGLAVVILSMAAYLGGNWYGGWIKYMSLLVLVAVLLYLPRVPMPRMAGRVVARLAQAAFPIYLLHRLVPEVLMPMAGLEGRSVVNDAIAIGGGLAIGLTAAACQRRLPRALANVTLPRRSRPIRRVAFRYIDALRPLSRLIAPQRY